MNAGDILSRYLESERSRQTARFLFLADANRITKGVGSLRIRGEERRLIYYRNPLQLRDELEDLKEGDPSELAAVVAFASTECLSPVADLSHRADWLTLSPSRILRFLHPEFEWYDEFDLLDGQDFWTLLAELAAERRHWEDTLTASAVPVFIAEVFLRRSLRGKLAYDEAMTLWERMESDDSTLAFFERNARLSVIVQRAIQRSIPVEAKLEHDPDFAVFLWTMYLLRKYAPSAELLLPQFFAGEVWEKYGFYDMQELQSTCDALLVQDPLKVVSQIRMAERSLSENPARERLFFSLLGLAGDRKVENALLIASREIVSGLLTRQCLEILARHIANIPSAIPAPKIKRVLKTLKSEHLATKYPKYFPEVEEAVSVFQNLVTLAELVEQYHENHWERQLPLQPIERWANEIFPRHLLPMGQLCQRLKGQSVLKGSLTGEHPAHLLSEAERILARANREFAALVQSNYIRWISQHQPPPAFTVDFLDSVLFPLWRQLESKTRPLLVLILFHGLRWDEWEVIAPLFNELLSQHRLIETRPMLCLLPTNRPYNTGALILGRFPSLADTGTIGALLSERLTMQGLPFIGSLSDPREGLPNVEEEGILLVNVSLPETGNHKSRRTEDARETLLRGARDILEPLFAALPRKAAVVAVSNGGTAEVTAAATKVPRGPVEIQPRWIGLDAFGPVPPLPGDVAFFNVDAIHLPNPSVSRCAFAYPNVWFSIEDREPGLRFLSGGISLEEMVVPCAIYLPRRFASIAKCTDS